MGSSIVIILADNSEVAALPSRASSSDVISGCAALFVFAVFLSYLTTEYSRYLKSGWGKFLRGPAQLVTGTVAATILIAWNFRDVGPFHAMWWAMGVVLGFLTSYFSAAVNHCTSTAQLTRKQWRAIRRYIFLSFFTRTLDEIEEGVADMHRKLKDNHDLTFRDSLRTLHEFVHTARDEAIEYVSKFEHLLREFLTHQDAKQLDESVNKEFHAYMERMLAKLHEVFEVALGHPHNLWVAARMFQVLPSKSGFKTVARAGSYSAKRSESSEVIPEDRGLPEYLRQQYKNGSGIVRLTSRTGKKWMKTSNDRYKEDRSILAGPIIIKTKRFPKDPVARELFMILYVNSPGEDVFLEIHEDMLRCCTDVLSLFYSLIRNKLDNAGLSELTLQNSRKVD